MILVNSSTIAAIDYNERQQILLVVFHRGGTYVYYDVPKEIYSGLLQAPSKGEYHKNNIKYSYSYKRIS